LRVEHRSNSSTHTHTGTHTRAHSGAHTGIHHSSSVNFRRRAHDVHCLDIGR
jgi:hypothetical protein